MLPVSRRSRIRARASSSKADPTISSGNAGGIEQRDRFNRNGGVVTAPGAGAAILGNAIFGNLASRGIGGIDIGYDGLSPNDACDADSGDENRQNFPALTSAVSSEGAVDVAFTLESAPNRTYRIEFFASEACDDSGYGQGRFYLGAVNVATAGCSAAATAHLDVCLTGEFVVTATATDPDGNTSEFSACRALVAGANAACASGGSCPSPRSRRCSSCVREADETEHRLPFSYPSTGGEHGVAAIPHRQDDRRRVRRHREIRGLGPDTRPRAVRGDLGPLGGLPGCSSTSCSGS
jgi:hypothetical protein